jgi:Fe-S oxidoreductase
MRQDTPKKFREDSCVECGTCLSSCPVLELSRREAVREIRKVKAGLESRALARCTTCLDCDFACPEGCNPGELFINRWHSVISERGLPARAEYFLPHSSPNFRSYVIDRMTPEENDMLDSWKDRTAAEDVCYPGCNMITTPLLTRTRALEGLDIRGSLEYCCGEMYFRMGLFDQLRGVARKTQEFFEHLGAKRVTILCTAGYYMFTRVLPYYGADYSFEMESYLELIKRRLESGELEFTRPLDLTVTVQESCYGKQFGREYLDLPREILEAAGCRIIEMKNHGECMLCCGIGAGFSPYSAYNPLRVTGYTLGVMRRAKESGADAVATYCSGCLQMFLTGSVLYRGALPTYHILELVSMALGEEPSTNHRGIGLKMLAGTLRHQSPLLLSRRRCAIPDI